VAEDLINAVQYLRLPSPFSLWTLFKRQYHSSNSSSCFFLLQRATVSDTSLYIPSNQDRRGQHVELRSHCNRRNQA